MDQLAATDLQDHARLAIAEQVSQVVDAVRRRGDEAVRELACRAGAEVPGPLRLGTADVERCLVSLPASVLEDIRVRQRQARAVALAQRASVKDVEIESLPGVRQGFRHEPVAAAAYVGDGRVGPVHAGVVTPYIAGVQRIVGCAPPRDGAVDARLVAALALGGASEIYAVGGVHALAALAVGTESIPRVDAVVGPSTPAMAEAKQRLFGDRGIDLAVGPSELLVIADGTADAELIAADMLACIAAGPHARAIVITTSVALAAIVSAEIIRGIEALPDAHAARAAWSRNGAIHLVDGPAAACALADRHGFERVEILTAEPRNYLAMLHNCGAVFLGPATTGAMADEMLVSRSGMLGEGVWIGRFLRTVAYQECCQSCDAARSMSELSERENRLEGLTENARSCDLRFRRAGV
jgi:sulfopropanediol 3-dehydrogenase